MVVVYLGAQYYGRTTAERQNDRDAVIADANAADVSLDVTAAVTRQSGEGMTQDQIDIAAVDNIGQWLTERMQAHANAYQEANGGAALEPMTPESTILEVGGKRLGVVRFRYDEATPAVVVVGIVGDEFVRVTCLSRTLNDVPLSYGPCDETIRETFGTSITGTP